MRMLNHPCCRRVAPFPHIFLKVSFTFPACNISYYGVVGRTYELEVKRPPQVPFLCYLNLTAGGGILGDLVQVSFTNWWLFWPFSLVSLPSDPFITTLFWYGLLTNQILAEMRLYRIDNEIKIVWPDSCQGRRSKNGQSAVRSNIMEQRIRDREYEMENYSSFLYLLKSAVCEEIALWIRLI